MIGSLDRPVSVLLLEDPTGHGVAAVRPIRDEIEAKVRALITELTSDPARAQLDPVD